MSTLLDTCAISELYCVEPEPAVESAIDALGEDAYISVVTISEMSFGVHGLPPGRRQRERLDQLAQTERRSLKEPSASVPTLPDSAGKSEPERGEREYRST